MAAFVLTVLTTVLSLSSAVLAKPHKQKASRTTTAKSKPKPNAPSKPKTAARPAPKATPQPVVKTAPVPTRTQPVRFARLPEPEPDDENTINVTLKTGDEELDDESINNDPIGRTRAAIQGDAPSPRSGRYRSTNVAMVSRALSYRGARYRFGATGANGAFDCSGYVQFLYRKEGVSIPRTAAEQFSAGRSVSRESLQSGDLVFFRNTYKHGISHVGMYLGDGQFIHAASSRRGVRIDSLSHDFYASRYAGARRYK